MRRAMAVALASSAVAGACSAPTAVDEVALLQVENIEILVAQLQPAQVTVVVHAVLPDACRAVGSVTQQRSGNTIDVTITMERSAQVCVQVIRPVEESVRLQGGFPPGAYLIRVNGFERRFTV